MKINKLFIMGFVVLLILQLLMFSGPIFADGPRDVLNLNPSLVEITSATFMAYIGGVEVSDYNSIPQNAAIKIAYAFNVVDADPGGVTAGDYFTITLPSALTSIASLPVVNETLSVISGGVPYDIATLSITTGGIATITFLPGIDSLSLVSANFSIEGNLNDSSINDGDIVSFYLVAGGTFYSIGFEPEEPPPPTTTASIAKSGIYNPNTNEIIWSVSVDSGGVGITINDVHVVDSLGANQTYKTGSTSSPVSDPAWDSGTGKYTFSLGNVTGVTSFTYKTTPTAGAFGAEGSTNTLTNIADLFIGPVKGDPVKTANASVTVTTDWIRKSGVLRTAEGTDFVDWTITLNNNNRTIPAGSTITDTLPQYLLLDGSTVKRNAALPSTFGDSFIINGQNFTYTFNAAGSDVTGQQVISFTTSLDPDYYKQQDTTGFANTGTLNIGVNGYAATSGTVGVPTSLLAKSGDGYDSSTQLITWKMEVNNNGQTIGDATITDTFGANQVFWFPFGIIRVNSGGSIVSLTNIADGGSFTASNQYYYNSTLARIYLGNLTGIDNPTLRFQTKVTNPVDYANNKTTNYSNMATLVGTGITDSTSTGTQQVQSLVLAKAKATGAGTDYNYTTHVLSWKITVNQNEMNMPNAVITDNIPTGQAYVTDSLLIDGSEPGPGVLNIAGNILTITLGDISTEKVLTFKTVVTDMSVFLSNKGNVHFINNANLSSGITGAPEVNVTATQTVNNRALSKDILTDYIPANAYIEWEVFINSNQAPMLSAFLSDVLQSGLELNVGSVELYLWNQASNGAMTIGNILLPGSYSFEYNYDTRIFRVNLPDGAQGYYLKFKTDVTAPGQYSNNITLSGESNVSDSVSSSVTISGSDFEAGASGTNGSITILKVDVNGNPITTGAVFELLDSLHNLKKTLTTGVDGKAIFDKLKFRTYYIREKTPPTGYQLSSEEIMVTLTNTPPEKQYQVITFRNSLLSASITLKKNNEEGAGLSGGRFSIYTAGDTSFASPLQTVMSGENGLIIFRGLNSGSYKIREVQPPSGYNSSGEVRTATLVLDEQNNSLADVTVAEPFVNQRIPLVEFGTIQLLKVNKKNIPLSGASFGLYNSNGELIQTSISAANGLVQFSEVPFGEYTIREIVAPKGYKLSDVKVSCTVSNSVIISRAAPYTIVNSAGSMGALGTLAQTGGFWDEDIILILGVLLIFAGIISALVQVFRRKRSEGYEA
jgi:uncharacterized surface anchored protein